MRIIATLTLLCWSTVWCGAQDSKGVRLLCNFRDTARVPVNGGGQHWNDVWGFVNKGKEYAAIGGTNGTQIIDVDNCREIAFMPGRSQNVIHRDYKTYSHYLYAVADEGIATMQVFDFGALPDSIPLVWESAIEDLSRSHNIFIDTAKARLYCASAFNYRSGHDNIRVYSLADPARPAYIASINEFANTHDLYVRNDTAWCSNSYGGYLMLDMSALPDYYVIGALPKYPYQGYNHSSWVGPDYIGVMADETFGKPVKVIDTRNPGSGIRVLSTFSPRGLDTNSIPHNPYLLGHYAFVSYYMDGLQVYDLSDPRHPERSGYYDTYPGPDVQGYFGAWGCYPYLPSRRILVSDMQTGLYVFDADEAIGIHKGASFSIWPNPAQDRLSLQLPFGIGGELQISIFNMVGAIVMQAARPLSLDANPPLEVSLPATMPAGMYVLRAAVGGQVFTGRFIKM